MAVEVGLEKPSLNDSSVELPSESSGQKPQNKPATKEDMMQHLVSY